MLSRKVDTLKRAMDVEAKKMRREVAAREKALVSMRVEQENKEGAKRSTTTSKGPANTSRVPGRYACYVGMKIQLWKVFSLLSVLLILFNSFFPKNCIKP